LPGIWKRAGAESRRGRSSEGIFREIERRGAVLEKLGRISFPRFRWERKAEIISGEEGGGQRDRDVGQILTVTASVVSSEGVTVLEEMTVSWSQIELRLSMNLCSSSARLKNNNKLVSVIKKTHSNSYAINKFVWQKTLKLTYRFCVHVENDEPCK
jgi:hypothetical protein